jgi:hypothetical protein
MQLKLNQHILRSVYKRQNPDKTDKFKYLIFLFTFVNCAQRNDCSKPDQIVNGIRNN